MTTNAPHTSFHSIHDRIKKYSLVWYALTRAICDNIVLTPSLLCAWKLEAQYGLQLAIF